jgi:hypothetical protein
MDDNVKLEVALTIGTPTHLRMEENGGVLPFCYQARHGLTIADLRRMSDQEVTTTIVKPMVEYLRRRVTERA